MTPTALECSTVVERLIGGERPSSDARLAEHVGSCLSCFRTATDLRGLPQLREQLLRAQGELPDPGEAFWASFPAGVSEIFERTQRVLQATETLAAPVAARPRLAAWWASAWAWLQMPVPAACAGAVGAAIIVVMLTRPTVLPEATTHARATGGAVPAEAQGEGDPRLSLTVGGLVLGGAIDDSIKDLDVGELRALRSELEHSMAGAGPKWDPAQGEAQDRAQVQQRTLAEGQAESSPTALSDDLDELSEAGLAVLAENLGGPI